MNMKLPSTFRLACALAISVLWPLQSSAQVILYQESFDAATPGQRITDPPLDWSAKEGNVTVRASAHPAWTGNAVIGGSATYPWGWVQYPIPNIPTNGVVKFTFDGWASYTISGGQIGLLNNKGRPIVWLAWNTIPGAGATNDWAFSAEGAAGVENDSRYVWRSPPDFMRNITVHGSIVVDFEAHTIWGELNDGTTTVTTPSYEIPNDFQLIGLDMVQDHRWGSTAADFDNLKLEWIPRPVLTIVVSEVRLCWPTVADVRYQVEYQSEIGGAWTPLGSPYLGDGTSKCVPDPIVGGPRRLYRVRMVP